MLFSVKLETQDLLMAKKDQSWHVRECDNNCKRIYVL